MMVESAAASNLNKFYRHTTVFTESGGHLLMQATCALKPQISIQELIDIPGH